MATSWWRVSCFLLQSRKLKDAWGKKQGQSRASVISTHLIGRSTSLTLWCEGLLNNYKYAVFIYICSLWIRPRYQILDITWFCRTSALLKTSSPVTISNNVFFLCQRSSFSPYIWLALHCLEALKTWRYQGKTNRKVHAYKQWLYHEMIKRLNINLAQWMLEVVALVPVNISNADSILWRRLTYPLVYNSM